MLHVSFIYLTYYGGGKLEEGTTGQGLGVERYGGALVATLADALHDGNLSKQGYLQLLGQLFAALFAEEVVAVLGQFGRGEPGHVLHQTKDGHVDLLVGVHIHSLAGIG